MCVCESVCVYAYVHSINGMFGMVRVNKNACNIHVVCIVYVSGRVCMHMVRVNILASYVNASLLQRCLDNGT